MILIIATIVLFAVIALLIYVATEIIPKRIFLRRHKVHRSTFEQFDITDEKDQGPDHK